MAVPGVSQPIEVLALDPAPVRVARPRSAVRPPI
jgi:hypothetical protein